MRGTNIGRILGLTILTGLVLSFQNCSQSNFNVIDDEQKAGKLSGETVFGAGQGEVSANGSGLAGTGNINAESILQLFQPAVTTQTQMETRTEVPLQYMCSNSRTESLGNLAQAKTLQIRIYAALIDKDSSVKCQVTIDSLKADILKSHKLDLSVLKSRCNLADGDYRVRIYNPDGRSRGDLTGTSTGLLTADLSVRYKQGLWTTGVAQATIVLDYNDKQATPVTRLLPEVPCDTNASPLVIHLHADVENAEPLKLTPQNQGILFDILGLNSDPRPHSLKQISWHRSRQYYFLTLPDSNGQVRGIDQLFGDNTMGPDGQFAHDGFHALAKFDGMSKDGHERLAPADSMITPADPIYESLRLWQDRNFDGIAQKSELIPLKTAGIEVIDLRFDPNYRERDAYGNETRYKSVVQDRKGKLHLLFDVWFLPTEPRLSPSAQRSLASQ